MIVIICIPKVEVDDLFLSDCSAAVDELLSDFTHFSDVEVVGN
jgi:hypothetical protein